MNIHASTEPLLGIAKAISSEIQNHKNTNVLLLLAGGSALDVLDEMDTAYINEYVTIMMMDERFTNDPEKNNFMQMSRTAFHTIVTSQGATLISSIPKEEENQKDFAQRIENTLRTYLTENPKAPIIALFGIGPDGHTAGIFPMNATDFVDTYGQGGLYVPVNYDKNSSPERASITPKFINQYITKSFVYARGEEKMPIVRNMHETHSLHDMPAHIHEQIDSRLFTDLGL